MYLACCQVLLEDGGASLGDFTKAEFLSLAAETLITFCGTGLTKKIYNFPLQQGVQLYNQNDLMGDMLSVMARQEFLYQSSDWFLSNNDPYWPQTVGTPYTYREDSIDAQMVQIEPAPDTPGTQIGANNPGYGVIGTTGQQLFFVFAGGHYGTIGEWSGQIPVIPTNSGYGVIGAVLHPRVFSVPAGGYGTLGSGYGWFFVPFTYQASINSYGYGLIGDSSGVYINTTPANSWPGLAYGWGIPCASSGPIPVQTVNNGYGVYAAFIAMLTELWCNCGLNTSRLNVQDFWIDADATTPQGFGTISGANGNPYAECVGQGFGIMGDMVPSLANLSMFATALPQSTDNLTLETWIENMPDSLVLYLKYGVLAEFFASSSENKSEVKAQYCRARFQEGLSLMSAIMETAEEEG